MTADAVLEAIVEPTRRRILDAVRTEERSVTELVERLGMSQPGVSRNLIILRNAVLVKVPPIAPGRLSGLRSDPLRDLDAWLEPYRTEWSTRLDALGRHLE